MEKSNYLQKSRAYKGYHYSVLDPSDLKYLHERTLEMFKQVKAIFEANHIKYMICGGTLLGALGGGHGHFIPWDDDFDVCIFEEDYDRAVKCLTDEKNGLSDGAVLQCKETDSNYYLGWMKVRDQRSHVYPDAPRFVENGVWIDLYKIVRTRESDVQLLIAKEAIDYLDRRLAAGGLTRSEYDSRIVDGQLIEKLEIAKEQRRKCLDDERMVYLIWSASKIVLEENWVEPLRTVVFEGLNVTTFNRAEEYLKRHYGDNYSVYPEDDLRRVGINRITRVN